MNPKVKRQAQRLLRLFFLCAIFSDLALAGHGDNRKGNQKDYVREKRQHKSKCDRSWGREERDTDDDFESAHEDPGFYFTQFPWLPVEAGSIASEMPKVASQIAELFENESRAYRDSKKALHHSHPAGTRNRDIRDFWTDFDNRRKEVVKALKRIRANFAIVGNQNGIMSTLDILLKQQIMLLELGEVHARGSAPWRKEISMTTWRHHSTWVLMLSDESSLDQVNQESESDPDFWRDFSTYPSLIRSTLSELIYAISDASTIAIAIGIDQLAHLRNIETKWIDPKMRELNSAHERKIQIDVVGLFGDQLIITEVKYAHHAAIPEKEWLDQLAQQLNAIKLIVKPEKHASIKQKLVVFGAPVSRGFVDQLESVGIDFVGDVWD